MRRKQIIAALGMCFVLCACAAQNYTVHPGAANTFDSQTYDSLLVAHSVIETTKADLAAGKFAASIAGNVRTALNDLVTAYNVADTAYLTYHAAAVAGTATNAQTTAVSNAIQGVNNATTTLTSVKGGS